MNIDFFINRPIFTSVCSFIFILAGLIAIPILPIAQYPQLTPPLITVTSTYVGANAESVESAVTTVLEEAINGAEGMKYMTSTSGDNGVSTIQAYFDLNRDQDLAEVDVQNRISSVNGLMPDVVKKTGVSISKQSTAIVCVYAFYSENGEYSDTYISNYVDKYIKDDILRVNGVGSVTIGGERKYAMRVWLDPVKLTARNLTANDIVNVINDQNVQVAAGQIGEPPIAGDQRFQMTVKVRGRLSDPKEFDNMVVGNTPEGGIIRLKDVGHCELGSENYDSAAQFKRHPAIGLLVYQLAQANSLQVYKGVQEQMAELEKEFPPGLKMGLAFETVSIVRDSIKEVVFTLFLAIILVVIVIFLFLQSFRTTLIPVITIPVSLIGTFAILKVADFSINTLTLFGIVLATGLVVDDAIVVIENIQRNINEKGLSPIEAASAGMKEVTGAVIASTLVLAAVFLPVSAFPGTTGQLYQQFALTIVFSVLISLFNALTLTPALSAIILKSEEPEENKKGFYKAVNNVIEGTRDRYHNLLQKVVNYKFVVIIVFIALLGFTYYLFQLVPGAFVPNEDQGYFITTYQGPEGTSLNYTTEALNKVQDILYAIPEVEHTFAISGFGFNGNGPNKAVIYTTLKPLEERKGFMQSASIIVKKTNFQYIKTISDAIVVAFEPPAIKGIGNVGGFQFQILDISGHTPQELADVTQKFVARAKASTKLQGMFSSYTANTPNIRVEVDRDKAKSLGIPLNNIFNTMQIFLGSVYVNDFDFFDRVYKVYVQADKSFRGSPENIKQFYVRSNTTGDLIPLSAVADYHQEYSAQILSHFNIFRTAEIDGSEAEGYSSGQALDEMEKIAEEVLPAGMDYQWQGLALEQLEAGPAGLIMFALGLLFVYLVLAAQYESFVDPVVIIIAVPLAIMGAMLAQLVRGLNNDVFCQIGLVMLIGLACKNSILIVEFANQLMRQGKDAVSAVTEAAQTRFRPIMMTSFAFILGIFPLVIATGAGAASRQSMGTAVFGGMFFSTLLSLFIVPVLFLVAKDFNKGVGTIFKRKPEKKLEGIMIEESLENIAEEAKLDEPTANVSETVEKVSDEDIQTGEDEEK